ncbi:MAG: hypothetical protein R3293_26145, partial [Candidatus Promineifilaceae bacterium]|nr:hypothetical protein [Candidatus Promineifilaceae bacterium]
MNNHAPFLDVKSFVLDEPVRETVETEAPAITPFVPVYDSVNNEGLIDPETEEYVAFLNELYDEEMDDALANLINEAT